MEELADQMDTSPNASTTEPTHEQVFVPVDEGILTQLTEMGFPEERSRRALAMNSGLSYVPGSVPLTGDLLEQSLAWLEEHQDDEDIDTPLLVSTEDIIKGNKVLTPEEKAQKLEDYKNRIKAIQAEKEKAEREAEIKREKERRERGQKMGEIDDERQRTLRKLEAAKLKREKNEIARERQRLREQIARDKEERMRHGGVLPSVLGVDGYNPSIAQYAGTDEESNTTTSKTPTQPPSEIVDKSIQIISKYSTNWSGGHALQLLFTFLKNITTQPQETKFHSINMLSNAFKTKLTPIMGSVALLQACGFVKEEDGENVRLVFKEELNEEKLKFLTETRNKLDYFLTQYKLKHGNPQ